MEYIEGRMCLICLGKADSIPVAFGDEGGLLADFTVLFGELFPGLTVLVPEDSVFESSSLDGDVGRDKVMWPDSCEFERAA